MDAVGPGPCQTVVWCPSGGDQGQGNTLANCLGLMPRRSCPVARRLVDRILITRAKCVRRVTQRAQTYVAQQLAIVGSMRLIEIATLPHRGQRRGRAAAARPTIAQVSQRQAVVVGSGPNGLAAAIVLAEAGLAVTVIEGAARVGGGTRSAELTLPGYVHDVCSAIHPFGRSSPFFAPRQAELARHGLHWVEPRFAIGHPLDDWAAGSRRTRRGGDGAAARAPTLRPTARCCARWSTTGTRSCPTCWRRSTSRAGHRGPAPGTLRPDRGAVGAVQWHAAFGPTARAPSGRARRHIPSCPWANR